MSGFTKEQMDQLAEATRALEAEMMRQRGPLVQHVRADHSDQSFWDSAVLCVSNRADMTADGAAQFADRLVVLRRERGIDTQAK